MDNSQMKADSREQKKATVAALVRELDGYKARLDRAKGLDDEDKRAEAEEDAQRRIDEVNAQLAHFGVEGVAPAKRAEKRPTVSARASSR